MKTETGMRAGCSQVRSPRTWCGLARRGVGGHRSTSEQDGGTRTAGGRATKEAEHPNWQRIWEGASRNENETEQWDVMSRVFQTKHRGKKCEHTDASFFGVGQDVSLLHCSLFSVVRRRLVSILTESWDFTVWWSVVSPGQVMHLEKKYSFLYSLYLGQKPWNCLDLKLYCPLQLCGDFKPWTTQHLSEWCNASFAIRSNWYVRNVPVHPLYLWYFGFRHPSVPRNLKMRRGDLADLVLRVAGRSSVIPAPSSSPLSSPRPFSFQTVFYLHCD